jgi:hypothetical protein
MTPEKILDYSVKFGVLPFVLFQLYIYRADLEKTKSDVKEMQGLLIDCYKDQIRVKPISHTKKNDEENTRLVAVLPDKFRCKICNN